MRKKSKYLKALGRDFSGKGWVAPSKKACAKTRTLRVRSILLFAGLWACLIVGRLYTLQISEFSKWRTSALNQHHKTIELASERGAILDAHGKRIAVSVPAGSVYVRPARIKDKEYAVQQISSILEIPEQKVREKLQSKSPFVWIKRQVPRLLAKRVADQKIPGAGYVVEARRYYPYNAAASVLIGKVGIDGDGLSGIEAVYNNQLKGQNSKLRVTRDAFGKRIEIPSDTLDDFSLPKGRPLQLTLDTRIQMIMDEELERGRAKANAKAALAVLVDSSTGDIMAMSQSPTKNFNTDRIRSRDDLRNLAVESVFEPGSVMKPIVAAAAMQSGVIGQKDFLDCEKGSYRFGRHTINDVHPSEQLSLHQVVVQSSNIGMTKVGMRLGAASLHKSLSEFGFGQNTHLGLPGESGGILRPVKKWAKVDVATHSYGQGIAITPLQMVRAVSAIANGGYLPKLRIIKENSKPEFTQILSPRVADAAREMMFGVVEDEHGTGKRATIEGIRIGGKTGTAQRARDDGRGYEPGSYVASFVGFADASDIGIQKKLVLYVVMDRPNTTSIYGGTLAGPVFQRIMQRSLHLLSTDEYKEGDLIYKDLYSRKNELTQVAYRR